MDGARLTGFVGQTAERHSFGPYYPGISSNPFEHYDSKENKKAYQQQQRQRTLERRIRDTKRQVQNMQTAVDNCKDEKLKFELQQQLDGKAYKLKRQNKEYQQYCKDNGLKEYAERLKVSKFERRNSALAREAAKRYEKNKKEG